MSDTTPRGDDGLPLGLEAWGWSAEFAKANGRVIAEHAGLFRVRTGDHTVLARPTGKLRALVEASPDARAVVGDWVTLASSNPNNPGNMGGEASLTSVLPRRSFIARKDPDGFVIQPIVSNIDKVFIVTALTGDVNPRRLERYLSTVFESGAAPVVVLTKLDLFDDPEDIEIDIEEVRSVASGASVHAVSPTTGLGMEGLDAELASGQTIALIGSSGVGKSTIINRWLGSEYFTVGDVDDMGHGRHTTTSRQLVMLPNGAMVIDTPGMREFALWDIGEGLTAAFDDIDELAQSCRFRDCRHESEPGCAVLAAVEAETLEYERYESFTKLRGEVDRVAEKTDALKRAQKKAADKVQTRAVDTHLKRKKKGKT